MSDENTGYHRRASDPEGSEFLHARRGDPMVVELFRRITDMDEKITTHMSLEPDVIAKAINKSLTEAFVDGDVDGHRAYHESVIQRNNAIAKLCWKGLEEITKYGLLGAAGWLLYALWNAVLQGPHK